MSQGGEVGVAAEALGVGEAGGQRSLERLKREVQSGFNNLSAGLLRRQRRRRQSAIAKVEVGVGAENQATRHVVERLCRGPPMEAHMDIIGCLQHAVGATQTASFFHRWHRELVVKKNEIFARRLNCLLVTAAARSFRNWRCCCRDWRHNNRGCSFSWRCAAWS